MKCERTKGLSKGQNLNILAASMANAVAEGLSIDEIEFLSSFLQLVGEALSNIAAVEALCQNNASQITEK